MERCETCRHWDRKRFAHYEPYDKDEPDAGWGSCILADSTNSDPEHPSTLALALDLESCVVQLRTAPNFGCVQWQAKEEEARG